MAIGLLNIECHRHIINQRSIDSGKAVAGCFSVSMTETSLTLKHKDV